MSEEEKNVSAGEAIGQKKLPLKKKAAKKPGFQSEFLRAENEDDDGYDPYSDRRPVSEPLFERDPWS